MKRNAIKQLIEWKKKEERHPLILSGIKGVGKTYLALDFAKSFYEGNIYINFETNAEISCAFEENEALSEPKTFDEFICSYYQIPKELLNSILIILDELQYSSSAYLSFLGWTAETEYTSCILISSEVNSFSEQVCNDFQRVHLYPFEFDEFLIASGYEWYVEVITAHSKNNRKIPDIVHQELLGLFDDFLMIGGMPAAINEYLNMESPENVNQIHQSILYNIQMLNTSRYSESHALKMQQIYDSLENQILKDNLKFQYRPIRKGATYAMFKDAIADLKSGGQLLKCSKMEDLMNHTICFNETSFQLFYFDVGVLNYILNKNRQAVYMNQSKRKKLVLTNYVMQSLVRKGYDAFFWESSSKAKVDILIHNQDGLIPFDIRVNENTRSKSINIFKNKHDFLYAIRISPKNFEFSNDVRNIPYYALFSAIG